MKIVKVKPDDLKAGENPRMILFNSEEDEDTFVSQMERAGPNYVETLEVFEINNEEYQLHSGYRRLHAAKRLNWDYVPCYVLTLLPPKEAFYRAIATNYHRNNLSGFDLVMSIVKLQEKYKQSQDQISKALNISQQYVSFLLTVSKFDELLNYLKHNGQISKAISLSQIKKEIDRIAILGSIDSYSTAQLREIVKDAKHIEVIKPPLESIAEASDDEIPIGGSMNTESREAGDYEDDGDASVKIEGHPSDLGESIPPTTTEDDGEGDLVDTEKHSPDGEPGKDGGQSQTEENAIQPSSTESSPSKNGWKKGYFHPCGTFLELGSDHITKNRNDHTCKDVLSVALNVNHKILPMIERKETIDQKNNSTSRTDWHITDSYGPFQVDNGRLEESIKTWNENKRITGLLVRALENVKQKRENDETERLKNLEKEPLIVGGS